MKFLPLSELAAAALLGSLMPASATAGTEDGAPPYFCGKSFTLFVMRGEQVSESEKHSGMYVLTTSGGDYVFSEGDFAVPVGAKPVREDNGVKVFTVTGGGRLIGYLIAVVDVPLKVLVGGRSFKGDGQDLELLGRFNFHPNRPRDCKASNP